MAVLGRSCFVKKIVGFLCWQGLLVPGVTKLAPGELLCGQHCPKIPGNDGTRMGPSCQLGFHGAEWCLLPQGHSWVSIHNPEPQNLSHLPGVILLCHGLPFAPWGDIVARPDPFPKPCAAFGHTCTLFTPQEPARPRGRAQLLPQFPGEPGAGSAGCQAGWKVLVRGQQIQAKLERKLISCCRAKPRACCRRLRAGASPGLAAAPAWPCPSARGEAWAVL